MNSRESNNDSSNLSSPLGGQGALPLGGQGALPLGGQGAGAFRQTEIIPLSEGSFTIDQTKQFVPFDDSKHELNDRPIGSLLVEIQPFIVVTSKDVLLLDTGLGFNDDTHGKMQLHYNLEKAGIQPEQVTKVLMTHLHKDHAGGISLTNDHSKLSLPNAVFYVRESELNFALEKGFPSFIPEEIEALKNSDRVEFIKDQEGMIDNYIQYRLTGAHSPHHQVFWIRDQNRTIFFGGDDAPQLQQMKVRYKTKYDFKPELAMQLRQEWWKQGNDEGWTFLFYHDIKTPTFGG